MTAEADAAPEVWKLSVHCLRAEVDALEEALALLAPVEAPATLVSTEVDARGDRWVVEAYFAQEPDAGALAQWPGAALVPVFAQDWVTASQRDLHPISAGRFHVHTEATRDSLPPGRIGLMIEAGQAFGTGQHATTYGCLLAIERLARRTRPPLRVLDVGTGTGILGMACARAWHARVLASDNDPVAIDFARRMRQANRLPRGAGRGAMDCLVADGLDDVRIRARAPYDLVIANILADPLIGLAPSIARALAPCGTVILSGLLVTQARRVAAAYQARGLRVAARLPVGDWMTLILQVRGGRIRPR